MKSNKKLFAAVGVLAIGAILMGGGLFIWQNQFNFNFSPKASTTDVQALLMLGERSTSTSLTQYDTVITEKLNLSMPKAVEVINRTANTDVIPTLRDQAVLGYNDVSKPITKHVYFTIVTGKTALVQGVRQKSEPAVIAERVRNELIALVELVSSRPGVFPEGFTIFLTSFPNSLASSADIASCKSTLQTEDFEYIQKVYNEIQKTIDAMSLVYPQYVVSISNNNSFATHTNTAKESWFAGCFDLNATGEQELGKLFLKAIDVERK